MEQHRLAVEFVRAAKRELSFPNLEIHLPAAFVRTLSTTTTERTELLNRFSDGISTHSTVHLQARGYLEPADADDRGTLALRFHGQTQLSAINVRDRICFR